MSVLKLYSTGCARNSRTIPYKLNSPVLVMKNIDLLMDWGFNERIEMDDDTAMSVDFAVLDDKWAYYVTIENRVAEGVFAVNFAMCGIKTYMLAGNSTIKGQWNKTPTWIDPDTITPAVSGYKRGETSIPLPGLLPEGIVYVEIRTKIKGFDITNKEGVSRYVSLGAFVKRGCDIYDKDFHIYDIVYDLENYKYSLNGGNTFTEPFSLSDIESISYSRICPYEFEGVSLTGATQNFLMKKRGGDREVISVNHRIEEPVIYEHPSGSPAFNVENELELKGKNATIADATKSLHRNFGYIYNNNKTYNKTLYYNSSKTVYFLFTDSNPGGGNGNYWNVTKFEHDPTITPTPSPVKAMYGYETSGIVFKENVTEPYSNPITSSGVLHLNLSDKEQQFGISTVFAPNAVGTIERSQHFVPWYYEVDNTGWYLNLDLPMNKMTIPSMKLPYMSSAWKEYQFREMEYDRAELSRATQYAKDKFWSDVAKGFGNGAVAGGFAGTHSPKFGAQMGIISAAGATVGAYADRQVEIANAQRQQDNKELLMKNAVDTHYNSGYGYRMVDNNNFVINIAMPIDDMENEVKISGYSCTGNLVASLERGFIQGLPEPSDAIKGTIRNLITSELQMGVWII